MRRLHSLILAVLLALAYARPGRLLPGHPRLPAQDPAARGRDGGGQGVEQDPAPGPLGGARRGPAELLARRAAAARAAPGPRAGGAGRRPRRTSTSVRSSCGSTARAGPSPPPTSFTTRSSPSSSAARSRSSRPSWTWAPRAATTRRSPPTPSWPTPPPSPGSIGVVMVTVNAQGLMEKIGVAPLAIKSGPMKDAGSPFRSLTGPERRSSSPSSTRCTGASWG